MSYQQAFDSFMEEDFNKGVDSATQASWGGSGYSVELFEDGSYRLLWNNRIGNLYVSEGIILGIPPLSEEEWDDDPSIRYYDDAEESLREAFADAMKEYSLS